MWWNAPRDGSSCESGVAQGFFPSAKMFEYTANIWWVFLEDLKGIRVNTGLTYRNLQHLNGDESRNDQTPLEHFVISFCSGICSPYNILRWSKMGGHQNAVKRKALKLNQHIAKATRSFFWKLKSAYFLNLFGVSSCKAVPLHAIHCLHSGGTCRHRHLSSSEDSLLLPYPLRTHCVLRNLSGLKQMCLCR